MAADRPLEKRQETSTTTTSSTTTSTTTTTTTSSTSTSTSTSSSSTSTSSSTASSQTSTSSTAASTSSSSTVSTQTSTSVTVTRSTNASGGVVTITRTVGGGTATPTSSGNSGGGGGFWSNKTAVGATFGIAGVIGLVVAFLLITTCIRRRRARKFDRAVSEAAAEAAATNADPFIGENDDTGYRGAAWDPRRRSSVGYGYGKLHDDPFGHGGPAAMGAAAGAAGLYGRHQSMNNGQYPKDAYGMNDLRASGTQPSVYSGTTAYASHPSYGAGAAYYTNDLPPVPPQQNAYGRPSFGSTAAPGIAGVGAAGGAYGQDTQAGYRNAPGNSIDGNEDAYGGYARNSVVDPYPNPYGAQTAYPGPSSPRASNSSPPGPSRSPPPAAPPSYSNHGHGSQGNEHYYTRNEKSRPLSSGSGVPSGGGMSMPLPPAAPAGSNAAHFQPPDVTPGVGTPDESYNNGGRILRVANE